MTPDRFNRILYAKKADKVLRFARMYKMQLFDEISYDNIINMLNLDIEIFEKTNNQSVVTSYEEIELHKLALAIAYESFIEEISNAEEESLEKCKKLF